MEDFQTYWEQVSGLVIEYGASLLLAILVLIIGLWLIKKIVKTVSRTMEKRHVDASLRPFLSSIIKALLTIMLVITVASMVGVEMTSFVAVLGAAGLAVGLALQGSLANFAGGVLILLLKPFKVGDFIEANGFSGTVREIQIFYTYITTTQNQEVVIPNGDLSNNAVKNYSFHDTRRIDMTFGIGYEDNIDQAKKILREIVESDSRILQDKGVDIFLEELADSSVNFHVRAWAKSSDFWDIYNNMNEKVKKAFDAAGVSIPFPQRDVHLFQENKA
ncbi:mechanosensitive ion channel family protein [Owenweeksia hongkongensis]|uniref:mechanosensitive ion channel family protein n=1 Tax=Owenweeksia hongkongensis TaxID=253245 RepID=UPI003A8CE5F6